MPPEIVIGDRARVERVLTEDFHHAAAEALSARGAFRVALSGGSIGPLLFPALARLTVDWPRVDFFWVDERAVPPDDPDSNFGDADRLWLQPAGVPPDRVHRMHGDDPDLSRAARAYEAELIRVIGNPPVLDYALLGVGPDGHVASLFPGHRALDEQQRLVVPVENAPKPPPFRLTLTMPMLAAAARSVLIASGRAKAEIVRKALEPGSRLPLGILAARARNLRVLLIE